MQLIYVRYYLRRKQEFRLCEQVTLQHVKPPFCVASPGAPEPARAKPGSASGALRLSPVSKLKGSAPLRTLGRPARG